MPPGKDFLMLYSEYWTPATAWAQRLPHIKILTFASVSFLSHQGSTGLCNTCLLGFFHKRRSVPAFGNILQQTGVPGPKYQTDFRRKLLLPSEDHSFYSQLVL